MAGENLTPQQIAFLERFILKGWFKGDKNKATTEAYERYLKVEQDFKDAMFALPGKDQRVKDVGGMAASAMAKKNDGDFDGAAGELSSLIPMAEDLGRTIASEHGEAVATFTKALSNLPGEDARVQSIASRAAAPSQVAAASEMPAAMQTLADLTIEVTELGETMIEEFDAAAALLKVAIDALPDDEPQSQDIASRAASALAAQTTTEKLDATGALAGLEAEAKQFGVTLAEEHAAAVRVFREKMQTLPPEEARVQDVEKRATGPLDASSAIDFPGATKTLGELTEEAKAVAAELIKEHPNTVRLFQEAVAALPSGDARRQALESRATSALKATEAAEMPKAVVTLTILIEETTALNAVMVKELADAVKAFQTAIAALPADDKRVKAILDSAADPVSKTLAKDSTDAIKALSDLMPEIEKAKTAIAADKTKMLEALALLADPVGATDAEQKGMKAERDRATATMAGDWPSPADFAKAQQACDALIILIRAARQLAALANKKPQSATKMRDLIANWDTVIGDTEVNDETIKQSKLDLTERTKEFRDASKAWDDADAMPEEDEEQIRLKEAAQRLAEINYFNKQAEVRAAKEKSQALLGKKLMNEAVTFGPLAPDAGRPFEDTVGEKLIEAFGRNPELANSAIKIAQKSADPAKIGDAIDGLCTRVEEGFKATGSATAFTNTDYCREYAENLLKSGDHIGGDFFVRMDAYIASGRQFETNTLGPVPGTFPELATARAKAVGGAMLADDGTFDPTTTKAKNAVADLMFNPDILSNATPSLALHTFETQKTLEDTTTKDACALIVNGIKAPTNTAGINVVRKTMGGDGPVSQKDAQQAALSAFFTPMDQGPVGSCFTTAPARRLRDEKPDEALRGFAEIASKGTFTSATGLKVPAVTKLNEGGNPLIQSWEFSVASAAATETGSREHRILRENLFTPNGLGKVVDTFAGTGNEIKKRAAQANLRMAIGSDFNFQYDPTSKVTDSNDGSSSTGRYRIQPVDAFGSPKGDPITTKEKFIEEMTATALKALSVDKTDPEGIAIVSHIKSDEFINAVCPGKYKPWEMTSGGREMDPTKALFGGTPTTVPIDDTDARIRNQSTPPSEGARTKEVLTGLVDMVSGSTDKFLTVNTLGIHVFNAVPTAKARPGEHTMKDLHGSTAVETAANIQSKVIDPGKTISDAALPSDRAAHLFDAKIEEMLANETEDALCDELRKDAKTERPTTDLKPADILAAVARAAKEFDKKRARRAADEWKAEQKTPQENADAWKLKQEEGGATISAGDLAAQLLIEQAAADEAFRKELTKTEKAFEESTNNAMLSKLANDLGSPQVLIADTNWGDERTHTFFVAMPDPTTGELRLWSKTLPGGDLRPEDRKWVDTDWDKTG